jgi:hypothetical protein
MERPIAGPQRAGTRSGAYTGSSSRNSVSTQGSTTSRRRISPDERLRPSLWSKASRTWPKPLSACCTATTMAGCWSRLNCGYRRSGVTEPRASTRVVNFEGNLGDRRLVLAQEIQHPRLKASRWPMCSKEHSSDALFVLKSARVGVFYLGPRTGIAQSDRPGSPGGKCRARAPVARRCDGNQEIRRKLR